MSKPVFHIRSEAWRDSVEIYFRLENADGTVAHAQPISLVVDAEPGEMLKPMMQLSCRNGGCAALQGFMDELWREGYRPKDIGTAGHLAATQAHLADFRALVAKALDVKLP